MLQLVFSKAVPDTRTADGPPGVRTLLDLTEGEQGILAELDLPEEAAQRLMALGFLPGSRIEAGRTAPGGDPRVYRVDGAEIALRGETAACLKLRASADDSGSP